MQDKRNGHSIFGRVLHVVWTLVVFCGFAYGGFYLLNDPKSPLPDAWNPTKPLNISDPVTPWTAFKLNRALASDASCIATLGTGPVQARVLPDRIDNAQCHIKGRVALSGIDSVRISPVETRCAIALRTAMWTLHDLQPKAQEIYGLPLGQIEHFSSYNCREIRTLSGSTGRMSSHATANALDVSGFRLTGGPQISLQNGWNGSDQDQAFLRAARDSACRWFTMVLGPDYNQLHADHFHIQSAGGSLCR
ncbi:extensin family protein [Algirhabdus cladophorae]|uniref:extensin-like domain-containing protein n=1 Tax=Algirhabdus cladophorae TaxID=3377108 RepID=UPI003B845F10